MSATTRSSGDRRTYVLDTSVLLADPRALGRFDEHAVVLPVVVLMELEAKRNHPDLGWAARTVLRTLEDLRTTHGSLTEPLPVNDRGGTLRVELNHRSTTGLPAAILGDDNDSRILTVAHGLATEGAAVTLVTKDLPLRLRASIAGLEADEYRNELASTGIRNGVETVAVAATDIDRLHTDGHIDLDITRQLPVNTGVILDAGTQSALGRIRADKRVHLVRGDRTIFDVGGHSAEQRIAIDLLTDPSVGIVSLGGRAGTGKSVLALAAGLDAVLERRTHRRVVVFRPLFAVGGQDLGYLPGDRDDKMDPWAAAVHDALDAIAGPEVQEEIVARDLLQILPLTHIRGRTLTDTFVIIDEAQNLEKTVLLTALSRLGPNSRVVLTHDIAQRDNLRVGRHDGIASVVESLTGHPLFAHLTFTRAERSEIAELVTAILDDTTG